MTSLQTIIFGLRNDREQALWLDAFWYGVEASKQIQEEVRLLARELDRPEKEV